MVWSHFKSDLAVIIKTTYFYFTRIKLRNNFGKVDLLVCNNVKLPANRTIYREFMVEYVGKIGIKMQLKYFLF